jgi:hypothetical protein
MEYEPFAIEPNAGGDYVWLYPRVPIGWLEGRSPAEWWAYIANGVPIEGLKDLLECGHLLPADVKAKIHEHLRARKGAGWWPWAKEQLWLAQLAAEDRMDALETEYHEASKRRDQLALLRGRLGETYKVESRMQKMLERWE